MGFFWGVDQDYMVGTKIKNLIIIFINIYIFMRALFLLKKP